MHLILNAQAQICFRYESLIAEVVFLLFLFIGNVTFKLWDSKIKHKEIIERTKFITKYLEGKTS